ncbi:MAG: hypothetical protein KatS3mg045_1825 [Bellilinea sp.]|nr:MAG: hypothetical protein KatS3mg045_1825 [Bellilinea sp.]
MWLVQYGNVASTVWKQNGPLEIFEIQVVFQVSWLSSIVSGSDEKEGVLF